MHTLTDLCKKALVEGHTEHEADELAKEWQDLYPEAIYTEDEIQSEMHRIIENAEIYTVCDNKLDSPYVWGNIVLSNTTYYLTEAEAKKAAESALKRLTRKEREYADIYASGPDGFVFYPIIEEKRRKFGEIEYDGQMYVFLEDAWSDDDWSDVDDWVYVSYAIKADERDLRDAELFRIEWQVINPDAEEEEDCCDWTKPYDVTEYGGCNLYQDRYF